MSEESVGEETSIQIQVGREDERLSMIVRFKLPGVSHEQQTAFAQECANAVSNSYFDLITGRTHQQPRRRP